METITFVTLILILTLTSGFFSSSETAFFSLSPMRVKAYKASKDKRKQLIATLISRPRELLVTIFMMNTIANILLQNVTSDMFEGYAGWEIKVGLPLIITLIFGEIIPKNIGLQNNTALAYLYAPFINFSQLALSPFRRFVVAITSPIAKVMFFYLKKAEGISKEELKHTLKTSEQYGILQRDEADILMGYLNLQGASVKEVMRPRDDMILYRLSEPLSKLIHCFVDLQCSKVPICEDGLNTVIGVISAKEFFLQRKKIHIQKDIVKYIKKPLYIPESTPAKLLLKRFDEKDERFALVVDEYGSVSGLITYEDLAERVIGEIADLRDPNRPYTRSGKNEIIAGGRLELTELESIFDQSLNNPHNMVTIGGWLMEKLGEIPKGGAKFENEHFFFHVLSADPNRIRRVYIRKKHRAS